MVMVFYYLLATPCFLGKEGDLGGGCLSAFISDFGLLFLLALSCFCTSQKKILREIYDKIIHSIIQMIFHIQFINTGKQPDGSKHFI